jgi:hypothetical protein
MSECLEGGRRNENQSGKVPAAKFAYLLTAKATTVAKTHGGAQSSKVTVGEYPSVAVSVGKKALNDSETTRFVSANANQ